MKLRLNIILLLLCSLFAAGFVYRQTQTITLAPDTAMMSLKGEKISLKDLRGQAVLITFWATDCPSCLQEIPDLIALHQQFSPSGLKIIAISMPYDPPNRVQTLAINQNLPYTIALDIDGALVKAFGDIQLTPTSFLINPQGELVLQTQGKLNLTAVSKLLKSW